MDGRAKEAIRDERDQKRFISIIDNPLKKGQQISLAEAALIRYFQPKYNTIYKKKFPSRELKVLSQCYEYDFSALAVEINTDELRLSLYSDTVRPAMHHIANIDPVSYTHLDVYKRQNLGSRFSFRLVFFDAVSIDPSI